MLNNSKKRHWFYIHIPVGDQADELVSTSYSNHLPLNIAFLSTYYRNHIHICMYVHLAANDPL